ncbi:MAG: methyltransferase [Verrucomicrobiaceae bacterium]|nr:methyltransferase [Verrucomicrobiaceae bacterium]
MTTAVNALFHALDVNPDIGEEGRVLFLRAQNHPALDHFRGRVSCQQTWKPRADELEAADFTVVREEQGSHPTVLVLPDPQRDLAVSDIARGYDRLAEGGMLMVAQHNDAGGKRTEQLFAELVGRGRMQTHSKHHSRVFWAVKEPGMEWNSTLLEQWRQRGVMRRVMDGRWWSKPGLFSWDRIDPGSALLATHLPADLRGDAADFGCGWGFLSDHLLRNCHDIDSLDLYDADADAFECARRNLGIIPTHIKPRPVWHDLTKGIERSRYDVVVMNPPFHDGKDQDPLIGLRFITTAATSLRPDGQLWLVANRQLPYESLLSETFAESRLVIEQDGFKVLHAAQPTVQPVIERRRRGKWKGRRR